MAAGAALRQKAAPLVRPVQATHQGAQDLLLRLATRAASAPFRRVGRSGSDLLLGTRAKRGPFAGKRLKPLPGGPGKGMRAITASEYADIMSGKRPGKAYKGKVDGKRYYYERKYGPGGLVGFAQRRPLLAAGGGLLAYQMLKKPELARTSVNIIGSGLPTTALDPAVMAQFQVDPGSNNPLARKVWGQ